MCAELATGQVGTTIDVAPEQLDIETRRAIRRDQRKRMWRRVWFYRFVYLLMLPGLAYFAIFAYLPMVGLIAAFQEFRPWMGFFNSPWVGFEHFLFFFNSPYFVRLIRNTVLISVLNLLFVFPAPIVLALMLNEITNRAFKRVIQTVSYLPYFISWIVVGGLLIYMFSVNVGFMNTTLAKLGREPVRIMGNVSAFLPLVVGSSIWKGIGWGSIIYLAAISGISPELYEAATVDGANRFQRVLYITLPGILPVIVIMFILGVGAILNVNFYQILVLVAGDATLYEVGDVIQTWVYRSAFFNQNLSLATAVGLFQGVIGLGLVIATNKLANRLTDSGLW